MFSWCMYVLQMLLEMASTITNSIDYYKWHRLLQMASTITNGIHYYERHRLLQMASTITNGIDCYKWHRLLQTASTITNDIDYYKRHRRFTKAKLASLLSHLQLFGTVIITTFIATVVTSILFHLSTGVATTCQTISAASISLS